MQKITNSAISKYFKITISEPFAANQGENQQSKFKEKGMAEAETAESKRIKRKVILATLRNRAVDAKRAKEQERTMNAGIHHIERKKRRNSRKQNGQAEAVEQ